MRVRFKVRVMVSRKFSIRFLVRFHVKVGRGKVSVRIRIF